MKNGRGCVQTLRREFKYSAMRVGLAGLSCLVQGSMRWWRVNQLWLSV